MNYWEIPPKRGPRLIDAASGREISSDRLHDDSARLAEIFRSAAPGGRKELAFLLTDNSPETIIAYLALLQAGVAAVLVNRHTPEPLLDALIECYRPEWLVGTGALSGAEDRTERFRFTTPATSIWIGRTRTDSWQPIHPEVDLLLTTSGSTGSPQLVRLAKRNLQANAAAIAEYLTLDDDQRPITSLPLHYSYGLSVVNSHLLVGATIVCTGEGLMTRSFWDAFRKHQCTSLAGVPYMYQMLRRLRFDRMDLPSLTVLTQAGGHLDRDTKLYLLDLCQQTNRRFFVMYGQTEATARISYVPPDRLAAKIDSIGIPIPGGEMRLFDGEREITTVGEIGEIVYRGPNVMLGYAEGRSCLAKGDELAGMLRTGDLAVRDADGYFAIVGRIKRFVKLFGHRVNLDEVERLLESRLPVRAACLGRDNILWVGFCPKDAATDVPAATAVRDLLCDLLQLNAEAVRADRLDEIPLTSSGKKDYPLLQTLRLGPETSATSRVE